MASVTIHLEHEAVRSLSEKAEEGGQSLETYLEHLVEHHIRTGGENGADAEADEDEFAERPWRGVFVPPRTRKVLFSRDLSWKSQPLPKRQPQLNMNWHREAADE